MNKYRFDGTKETVDWIWNFSKKKRTKNISEKKDSVNLSVKVKFMECYIEFKEDSNIAPSVSDFCEGKCIIFYDRNFETSEICQTKSTAYWIRKKKTLTLEL